MRVTPRYDGPAILEIDGRLDDQLVPVTRQRRRFAAMLASLADDQWHAPSRCEGWDVQDVASHLVGVDAFWHMSVGAGLSGEPTRMLTNFDPASTPAMLIEPMRALPPADVLAQLDASIDRFLDVLASLDDAGWATPAETPPGYLPVRLLAHHALWDCWVHERDVALPLGLVPPVEADEVAASMRYAAAFEPGLPHQRRPRMRRPVRRRGSRSRHPLLARGRRSRGARARRKRAGRHTDPARRRGGAHGGAEHPSAAPGRRARRMARAGERPHQRVQLSARSRP